MTELWAIPVVVGATVLGALGSLLFKMGSEAMSLDIKRLVRNYHLMGGFLLYGISALFFIFALKGGELSVLYPFVSTSYIWVCLLSVKFLHEKMNRYKWIGIVLIMLGVSVIGLGS